MLKLVIGALLLIASPALAETVHSLDQVPPQLKTPEAKKFYSEQMQGKPAPDLLGVRLPAALPADAITHLLVPADDKEKPSLIGAKPWPARPSSYVAIVCTGGEAPYGPDEPLCAQATDGGKPFKVYVGVIAVGTDGAPRLVAAKGPVGCGMDWDHSGLPRRPTAADDAKGGIIAPERYDGFDLARYRIAREQTAFGLRGAWLESYAGGGANFTGLCLFAIDGDKLRQVLAVPMSAFSDIAGDWHKDGTRDHDITDAANVLIVSSKSTYGHFDLIVRPRKGGKGAKPQIYRWSRADGAYRPRPQ